MVRRSSGLVSASLSCNASATHHLFKTHTIGFEPMVWASAGETFTGVHGVWEYRVFGSGIEASGTAAADSDLRLSLKLGYLTGFGAGGAISVGYAFRGFLLGEMAAHGYNDDGFSWILLTSVGLPLLPW